MNSIKLLALLTLILMLEHTLSAQEKDTHPQVDAEVASLARIRKASKVKSREIFNKKTNKKKAEENLTLIEEGLRANANLISKDFRIIATGETQKGIFPREVIKPGQLVGCIEGLVLGYTEDKSGEETVFLPEVILDEERVLEEEICSQLFFKEDLSCSFAIPSEFIPIDPRVRFQIIRKSWALFPKRGPFRFSELGIYINGGLANVELNYVIGPENRLFILLRAKTKILPMEQVLWDYAHHSYCESYGFEFCSFSPDDHGKTWQLL